MRPASVVFAVLVSSCSSGFAVEQVMIVLDASGSMWRRLEGRTKIEIARETLAGVLGSVPEDLALGLIAYGHRRKADCTDIELLVPPATASGDAVVRAANALKPKGKTPLSAAVGQAAERLKYTEEKATVILLTDGLETCDQDPCAVGERLAEAGIDFTAHVVGFGLSEDEGRQVACLAENTGGLYLSAADAEQLGTALAQTVATVAEPKHLPLPEVTAMPEASLSADDVVPQAGRFTVSWEGPGDRYDAIQIFDPTAGNGEGKVVRSTSIVLRDIEKRQASMAAPANLGRFELRYWDGRQRRVIATRPIEVIEMAVSLSAPESVEIGRTITVEWVGPGGRYDAVQIFDPAGNNGEGRVVRYKNLRNDDLDSRIATLAAPAEPGEYELRYWNGENTKVLAVRSIQVEATEVSLAAPDRVAAGHTITVEWVGPGGRYDAVQIFDSAARNGQGKVIRDQRLRNDDFDNRRARLPAPAKAGSYELRYWNGENKSVLATRTIEVQEAVVALRAAETVGQAAVITVEWAGPGGRYDAVQLFDPSGNGGQGSVIRDKRLRNDDFDNHRVRLPAPAKTGTYELRYWNGDNKAVLATHTITVVETDISLSAPDTVPAGEAFVVEWVGPGGRYDDVQIVDANGKSAGSRRLRNARFDDGKVSIKAPQAPGQYTLRYWNGENKAVLATRPLTVR